MNYNEFISEYKSGNRNFENIIMNNANMANLDLRWANFKGAKFTGCSFDHSDLSDADFNGAIIFRCTMIGAILKGTKFDHADLSWTVMRNSLFDKTSLRNANMTQAHLCKSDIMKADIKGANFNMACLIDTKLTEDQIKIIPKNALLMPSQEISRPDSGQPIRGYASVTGTGYSTTEFGIGGYISESGGGAYERSKTDNHVYKKEEIADPFLLAMGVKQIKRKIENC